MLRVPRPLWMLACLFICPAQAQVLEVKETEAFDLPEGASIDTLEVDADGKHWWCEVTFASTEGTGFLKAVVQNGQRTPGFSELWAVSENRGKNVLCRCDVAAGKVLLRDGVEVLSATNIHIAAVGSTGRWAAVMYRDDAVWLVVDGKEEKVSEEIEELRFSPDGSRLVSRRRDRDRSAAWVVIDGEKQKKYRETSWVRFSADSKHLIYPAAIDKDKWVVVVDAAEKSKGHRDVYRPRLSADGKRFAFIAGVGKDENCAVIDGAEGKVYKRLNLFEPPDFSPDGAHYAFPASLTLQSVAMVHDGVEGKAYANAAKFSFSPDGKRLAYWGVQAQDRMHVVLDGSEIATVEAGSSLTFSPDSKSLAYLQRSAEGWALVHEGAVGPRYAHIVRKIHFTGPKRGHVFAVRESKVWKVEFGD